MGAQWRSTSDLRLESLDPESLWELSGRRKAFWPCAVAARDRLAVR
jgi:hypothetical protein